MGESELRNDDDIEAILKIAVSRAGGLETQTLRERLLASAEELGLTPEQVAEAEDQWRLEQKDRQDLAEFKAHQRKSFRELVLGCLFATVFLAMLNFMTDRTVYWAIVPIFALLVGIAIGVVETFFPKSEHFKQRFARWRSRRPKRGT